MFYLTTYTYIEQIKHKMSLGFKLDLAESFIIVFYLYNFADKMIDCIKNTDFKRLFNEVKHDAKEFK